MKKKILFASCILIVIAISFFFLFTGKSRELPPPKNIIFIVVDAVRADHIGAYGYKRNTSPAIDSIARDGVVFENAYSQASWTLASMASIFTSLTPDFNGTDNMKSFLSPNLITIAEYLGKTGYNRMGASNNPLVVKRKKMSQGFWIWAEYMRDPSLTHFCLSYLNPENISYHRLKSENYFTGFSFDKPDTKLQQQGTYYDLGYFDRKSFKTSSKNLKLHQPLVLSTSNKSLDAGEYNWGLAVEAFEKSTKITVSLVCPTPAGREVIEKKSFIANKGWKQYSFPLHLNSKVDILQILLEFDNDEPRTEIAVDDVFIIQHKIPKKKNLQRFIFLHYINTHEPHDIPIHVSRDYLNLFKGDNSDSRLISRSNGDPFDLSNGRYILHRMRTDAWIKGADEISFHFDMYDREIRYMDDQIKKIVDYLKKTGAYDDTMFIILADHGEEFLDHGHISHGLSLYKELLHIPLIISYPKALPKGERIESNVAAMDIFPTLQDMLHGTTELDEQLKNQLMGRSLLPLIFGEEEKEPGFIFSSDYFTSQTSVIWGDWHFIRRQSLCGSKNVLFNKKIDPKETQDLSLNNPEITSRLESAIRKYKENAVVFRKKYTGKKLQTESSRQDKEKMRKGLLQLGYIDAAQDVFGVSKKYEDAYCNVVRYRLQVWLFLKMYRIL